MAAAAVCPPSAGSFSPSTLFECTVSNASMLVDSMEEKDLVIALRITNQLQSKIVDVLDPKLNNLVERLNAPPPVPVAPSPPPAEVPSKRAKLESLNTSQGLTSLKEEEEGISYNVSQNFTDVKVKEEELNDSEDDDVILLEPDDGFGQAALEAATGGSHRFGGSHFQQSMFPGHHGSNMSPTMRFPTPSRTVGAVGGAAGDSGSGDVRSYMRQAYKNLKGAGPHLFDFSQPFSSATNQAVAQRVVEEAQRMIGGNPWGDDVWRSQKFANIIFNCHRNNHGNVKRKHDRRRLKLSRRQRSFESIFQQMDPDSADRYRVVLTRDFTSSDEEVEDDTATPGESMLRVRVLPWESTTVRDMKNRLDEVYLNQFASEKQRAQMARTVRDAAVRSARLCPEGAPPWAVQQLGAPPLHPDGASNM